MFTMKLDSSDFLATWSVAGMLVGIAAVSGLLTDSPARLAPGVVNVMPRLALVAEAVAFASPNGGARLAALEGRGVPVSSSGAEAGPKC
jgi:hypothetical protein